jgi:Amt family ammonium transporter
LIDRVMGFRLSAEDETTGVDLTQHAETAYAEGVQGHQPLRRRGSANAEQLAPEDVSPPAA